MLSPSGKADPLTSDGTRQLFAGKRARGDPGEPALKRASSRPSEDVRPGGRSVGRPGPMASALTTQEPWEGPEGYPQPSWAI
jgi:hypothetical protein